MQCTICLDDSGEVIQKGCCCRGDAGAVHLECLIALASHGFDNLTDVTLWENCGTCKELYTGPAQLGLARALWDRLKGREEDDEYRLWAGAVLGAALDRKGLLAEAESLKQAQLAVMTRIYGPDHVKTACLTESLGVTCHRLGHFDRAIEFYSKSLKTFQAEPERWAQEISRHHSNLAITYSAVGRFGESEILQREVFDTRKTEWGIGDTRTLTAGSGLATALMLQGKNAEATEVFDEIIATMKRVLGPDHPNHLEAMGNLAVCYMYLERYADAEATARETLSVLRRVCGDFDVDTSRTLGNLGLFIDLQGRHEEAEDVLREAVSQLAESAGVDHTEYLFAATTLGGNLAELGRHEEAQALLRETHTKLAETLGLEHPRTLRTQSTLGGALLCAGIEREGGELLQQAHVLQSRLFGDLNNDTRTSKARLDRWGIIV